MKRTILFFLIVMILSFLPVMSEGLNAFSDVQLDHWSYQAVQELSQKGLADRDYVKSVVKGDEPITRYEMAMIVARILARIEERNTQGNGIVLAVAQQDDIGNLIAEYKPELSSLGIKVDTLSSMANQLQGNLNRVERELRRMEDQVNLGVKFSGRGRIFLGYTNLNGPGSDKATDQMGWGSALNNAGGVVVNNPYLIPGNLAYRWVDIFGTIMPVQELETNIRMRISYGFGAGTGLFVEPQEMNLKYKTEKIKFEIGDYQLKLGALINHPMVINEEQASIFMSAAEERLRDLKCSNGEWPVRGVRLELPNAVFGFDINTTVARILVQQPLKEYADNDNNSRVLPGVYARYLYGLQFNKLVNGGKFSLSMAGIGDDPGSLTAKDFGRDMDGNPLNPPVKNEGSSVEFKQNFGENFDLWGVYSVATFDNNSLVVDEELNPLLRDKSAILGAKWDMGFINLQMNYQYTGPEYVMYPSQSHGALDYGLPVLKKQGDYLVHTGTNYFQPFYTPNGLGIDMGRDPRWQLPYDNYDILLNNSTPYGDATPNRNGYKIKAIVNFNDFLKLSLKTTQLKELASSFFDQLKHFSQNSASVRLKFSDTAQAIIAVSLERTTRDTGSQEGEVNLTSMIMNLGYQFQLQPNTIIALGYQDVKGHGNDFVPRLPQPVNTVFNSHKNTSVASLLYRINNSTNLRFDYKKSSFLDRQVPQNDYQAREVTGSLIMDF